MLMSFVKKGQGVSCGSVNKGGMLSHYMVTRNSEKKRDCL